MVLSDEGWTTIAGIGCMALSSFCTPSSPSNMLSTVAMEHFKEIKDGLEYTLLELGKEKGRQEIAERASADSFD